MISTENWIITAGRWSNPSACCCFAFRKMDFSPEILYNISHEISRKDEEQLGEEACVCDRHGTGKF